MKHCHRWIKAYLLLISLCPFILTPHSYLFFKGNHFNEFKEYLLTRLLWYIAQLFSKCPLLLPPLLASSILGVVVGLALVNGL